MLDIVSTASARYAREGVTIELTISDMVEIGMGSVTAAPPLTTVVNEYGTTTFSRRDGRLLTQVVDPEGKGFASLMAANGVSVAAAGRGEDMPHLIELISTIDLAGIERLERPALPSVENDGVDSLSKAIAAMAQAEWSRRDPAADAMTGWALRITVPIPEAWPVGEGTTITWYLYAAAVDPATLADGERIAAPWGRITHKLASSDAPVFKRVAAGLTSLGTQGVKPLSAADVACQPATSPEAVHRSLFALATTWAGQAALTRDTLESYRLWQRQNGVIATAVLPRRSAIAQALR